MFKDMQNDDTVRIKKCVEVILTCVCVCTDRAGSAGNSLCRQRTSIW